MAQKPRRTVASALTPAAAITGTGLLADAFRGASWDRWRSILKAAHGEPLTDAERVLFAEVAERDPPAAPTKELWIVAGRRSGKDSIASALATVAALGDYSAHLRPGERATIVCLATDRTQAKIVFRFIAGYFAKYPLLQALVEKETDDTIELTNNVEIIVSTNSYRAVRGRTIVCAIFDEVAYWRDDSSATPDSETYNAVIPGMMTMPNAMLIGISSPHRRSGLLFEKWAAHYGKPDPDVLVVRGRTQLFNPTAPQKIIDAAMARDPERAAAEYMAEWRSDIGELFSRDLLAAAVDNGVVARPPQPGATYFMFSDPSGGRGDGFSAAVAHADGDAVILDQLYERMPPFNPTEVVAEVADLARRYAIPTVTGDRYAAEWVAGAFAAQGISYVNAENDRSALYLSALPLFAAGRARLLDHPKLLHQLASLERRASRFGRDAVNHPRDGADDCANAAAGALVLAASDAAPTLLRHQDLLVEGRPVEVPKWCEAIVATAWVGRDGTLAVCYFAYTNLPAHDGFAPVVLIDMSVGPLAGNSMGAMIDRLEELHRSIPRCRTHIAFLPRALMEHVHLLGWDGAAAYEPEMLSDPQSLAISAAVHIAAGRVKIATPAAEKARTLPLAGAMHYRPGEDIRDNPLRMALILEIALALTPETAASVPVLPAAHFGTW